MTNYGAPNTTKKKGNFFKTFLFILAYIYVSALLLPISMFSLSLINLNEMYLTLPGTLIPLIIFILLFVFCILYMVSWLRRRYKETGHFPLALIIGECVIFVIMAVIFITTSVQAYKSYPNDKALTERQISDISELIPAGFTEYPAVFDDEEVKSVNAPESCGKWIALRVPGYLGYDDYDENTREIAGWSDAYIFNLTQWLERCPNQESIDEIDTVVICRYGKNTAEYASFYGSYSGGAPVSSAYSEYVLLTFVNAKTGEAYKTYKIEARELPNEVSAAPHYDIDYVRVRETINDILSGEMR